MNAPFILRSLAAVCGFFAFIFTTQAIEPWADAKLPVTDGLACWFDASAQKAARAALKLPPAQPAQLDWWLDGSGNGRHASQPVADFRPVLKTSPGGTAVRFDGANDFFATTLPGLRPFEATIFFVAAPHVNPGLFRAFLSLHPPGQNDYVAGLNVDLGGAGSGTIDKINIEAAGAGGERNLLSSRFDFGTFHVYSVAAGSGANGLRLFVDGKAEGQRDRKPGPLGFDELLLGARCYGNDGLPAAAASFLRGDIAEVLVFKRALSDAERQSVESWLLKRHSGLRAQPVALGEGERLLVPVKNPPPLQMLVPGFTVRELPLSLTNIDCLRYRHDGVLVAGGYNGKIWLLRDTDGDGLEDRADLYWESAELKGVIGMTLTLKDDPRGQGVFVATQGRILFIPDKNGDGRGDEERVVASGWEKQVVGGGGGIVDSLGLTMDRAGNLYFGLGTSAYNNAYLVDAKNGTAGYRLTSERGTIQRVSADFTKREIVCTGIRFPVGAAFNRHGDLFVTDQEGATWLPNGNPFDELLHIEPGRHYGFPPRHPKWLPNVIDEPSVFDYGPQHQSTCGFAFNEGAATFGPAWWAGDALVTGESRGKLWRTKLVKTPAGYVAQNQLIACLAMLTVDVAVSPRGDLLVACHSGGPDWGTGPQGAGKIFNIAYTAKEAPQPVLAWSASPTELRVTFDRDLDATKLKDLAKHASLEQGRYVAAGDRFESFRPGYQVVMDQMATPRFEVPILGAALAADRRTLVFTTAPRTAALNSALRLPDFTGTSQAPRHADIDVACDLSGVAAYWRSADRSETWRGWLPHVDLAVARELTVASAEHARFFDLLKKPGLLVLWGQLDLWQMLQPAIQPGAQLDYERPNEKVRIHIPVDRESKNYNFGEQNVEREGAEGDWLKISPGLETGGERTLTATWSTADDPRPRAFPLRRFLLPWAERKTEPTKLTEDREIPDIEGGNWLRGRKLFFDKSTCSRCHAVRGEGGIAGPDLSNLTQRDYASVVRDIREPGAALNPDHLAFNVEPKDGSAFAAVLIGEDKGTLQLADVTGALKSMPRSAIKSMEALPTSLMPPGLLEALTPTEQRDLLTYLLIPALEPAPIEAANPPPPRKRAEVEALLKSTGASGESKVQNSKFKIVLCAGPKDHGRGEHDYPLWQKRWSRLLAMADGVEVSTAWKWPSEEQWKTADVIAFFSNNPDWNANTAPQFDAFLARGGGAAFFHFAVDGHAHGPELAERIGYAIAKSACKYRHGPVDFTLQPHPLIQGFPPLHLVDETYWNLVGDPSGVQLIASALEDGEERPQIWTREHGGGRVFVSVPGHYNWTFDDPFYRLLAFRGLCWVARQPIDRLSELITIGARVEP